MHSTLSGEYTYKTFTTIPAAPIKPRPIKISADSVSLRWTFSKGEMMMMMMMMVMVMMMMVVVVVMVMMRGDGADDDNNHHRYYYHYHGCP